MFAHTAHSNVGSHAHLYMRLMLEFYPLEIGVICEQLSTKKLMQLCIIMAPVIVLGYYKGLVWLARTFFVRRSG